MQSICQSQASLKTTPMICLVAGRVTAAPTGVSHPCVRPYPYLKEECFGHQKTRLCLKRLKPQKKTMKLPPSDGTQ